MTGISALFSCGGCSRIVSLLVENSSAIEVVPVESMQLRCSNCDNSDVQAWGVGEPLQGPCPRCGRTVVTTSIGIAD